MEEEIWKKGNCISQYNTIKEKEHVNVINNPCKCKRYSDSVGVAQSGNRNQMSIPALNLKNHFNIILPSTPKSTKCYLSLKSPHKNLAYTSAVYVTCHMPHPSAVFPSTLLNKILHTPLMSKFRATCHIQICKYLKNKCISELPSFCASSNYCSLELFRLPKCFKQIGARSKLQHPSII
jgi:hypothetical protein